MAKKEAKEKRIRRQVDLSEATQARINSIMILSDNSHFAEFVRKASIAYEVFVKAKIDGDKVVLHRKDGTTVELISF